MCVSKIGKSLVRRRIVVDLDCRRVRGHIHPTRSSETVSVRLPPSADTGVAERGQQIRFGSVGSFSLACRPSVVHSYSPTVRKVQFLQCLPSLLHQGETLSQVEIIEARAVLRFRVARRVTISLEQLHDILQPTQSLSGVVR